MSYISLGKSAMNAPRLCKLRKNCIPGIGQSVTGFVADFPIVNEI
jgi:hypothetical protein